MAIDFSRLLSLTARSIVKALKEDGFVQRQSKTRRKRSALFFAHPDGRSTTIHLHNMNQTFKVGTLKSIIQTQAQWDEADLRRLGLLK